MTFDSGSTDGSDATPETPENPNSTVSTDNPDRTAAAAETPESAERPPSAAPPPRTSPADPEIPTDPEIPADPANPTPPSASVPPSPSAESALPVGSVRPGESAVRVESVLPVESVPPLPSAEPALPADSALPVQPALPIASAEPIQPAFPADSALPVQPALPIASAEPVAPAKSPRRRLVVAAIVAAAVVVAAAATAAGVAGGSHRATATATATAHSAHAPLPSPTPLTPEAYQALLTDLDRDLTTRVQAIAGARDPIAVSTAVFAVQGAITDDLMPLEQTVSPTAVTQQVVAFIKAMRDLLGALSKLTNAGAISMSDQDAACQGSAAMVDVVTGTAADEVRAASAALATADPAHPYHVGSFLPATAPRAPGPRPANGTVVKRSGSGGYGKLTVKNQGTLDIAVSLVPDGSSSPVVVVYVRSNSETTVGNIHDGTYTAYDTHGREWDSGAAAFARGCEFEKLDASLKYQTTGNKYTVWTLTLDRSGPSPSSGTPTSGDPVDPAQYPH